MLSTPASPLVGEGIAAAKKGDKALARQLLGQATAQQPENELAWLWLAGIAETPQVARACLKRVLALNPANTRASDGLKAMTLQVGVAEARAGRKAEARLLLTEAVELDPGSEVGWQWLASLAESPAEALPSLQRILAINPANEQARKALDYYTAQMAGAGPGWQCPFCGLTAEEEPRVCGDCGALLHLDDVNAFVTHEVLKNAVLSAAVPRLLQTITAPGASRRAAFRGNYHLGLAHLNLKQFGEALQCFQKVLQVRPDQELLRSRLPDLLRLADEAAEQKRQLARRCYVLVVDDSPTVRKMVALTLEQNQIRVATAADSLEAIASLRGEIPDLILLDITMPGMNGYELCRLIKSSRDTAHVPVVMLSGKDGFFDKIRGRMAGSSQYLTKPFKADSLVQVVHKHCRPK